MEDTEKIKRMTELFNEAKQLSDELSPEELAQVTGAGECMCALGGGGTGNDKGDQTCGCAFLGFGMTDADGGDVRCGCSVGGFGSQGSQ
jgi:hypothetical protein